MTKGVKGRVHRKEKIKTQQNKDKKKEHKEKKIYKIKNRKTNLILRRKKHPQRKKNNKTISN